ncbi:Tubulointerstitial nephritis antigen-like [Branchiostoma belcheri]|nr:Tubulointerstitial nephritis antigen-like [Branchiostoma belcheri]
MSRRRGRRRNWRSRARFRAVTFPCCPPSDTQADQKSGRLRFLKAAAITVLILVAVTSSLSNTGEDKPTINLPPYGSKGDDQAGSGDSEGLSPYVYSGWTGVRVKPRDFVENDAEIHNGPDGMASTDAPLTPAEVAHDWGYTTGENHCNNVRVRRRVSKVPIGITLPADRAENARVPDNQTETFRSEGWKRFRGGRSGPRLGLHNRRKTTATTLEFAAAITELHLPVGMTPPADHTENARVPDNQTETFRSEGWKRFRVEQNHTEGANSTTEAPTAPPHVVGDEEAEVAHDWGYTTGENHCNNARVRRRVSKVPFPATDDSSATQATHLELKPNSSLDKKVSGDVDSMGTDRTGAMDNVFTKNSTDLNLYLDAVLTDIMKSHKRKHYRGLKRIKRRKAIVVLAAVGVLIAGSVGHVYLRQIVP